MKPFTKGLFTLFFTPPCTMGKNDLHVKKKKKRNPSSDFLNGYFSLFWIQGLFLRENGVTKPTGLKESSKYGHTVTCIHPWVSAQLYPVFKPAFQPVAIKSSMVALCQITGPHYLNVFSLSQCRPLHKPAGSWLAGKTRTYKSWDNAWKWMRSEVSSLVWLGPICGGRNADGWSVSASRVRYQWKF